MPVNLPTAVILAAGQSTRMGTTKQLLPWGQTTMLGQTIRQVKRSLLEDILVVTGHQAEAITAVAQAENVATIYNPRYATDEMLASLQTAVKSIGPTASAVLVVLADQPLLEPETINLIVTPFLKQQADLIAPIFQGQRGNPVLIGQTYFEELLALPMGKAPRTLLKRHKEKLRLVPVSSDSILHDLDTPERYARVRPPDTD